MTKTKLLEHVTDCARWRLKRKELRSSDISDHVNFSWHLYWSDFVRSWIERRETKKCVLVLVYTKGKLPELSGEWFLKHFFY